MAQTQKSILLLDGDEKSAQEILSTLNGGADGFTVNHVQDVAGGLNYLEASMPDLVIVDDNLIEGGAFSSVRSRLAESNVPSILLSGVNGTEVAGQCEKAGAKEYLVKSRITPFYLMKTIANTLRMSEMEQQLNQVFDEYSGRIESFSTAFDVLNEAVVIINKDNVMQYANARATGMLGDESFQKKIAGYLAYHEIEEEETIELKGWQKYDLSIRVNKLNWNKEKCNLFIIERTAVAENSLNALTFVSPFLDALNQELVLLKNGEVACANAAALLVLKSSTGVLNGKRVEEVINSDTPWETITSGKAFSGNVVNASDAEPLNIVFTVKDLKIADQDYQLLLLNKAGLSAVLDAAVPGNSNANSGALKKITSRNLQQPAADLLNDMQLVIDNLVEARFDKAIKYASKAEWGIAKLEGLLADFRAYLDITQATVNKVELPIKNLVDEVMQGMSEELKTIDAEINISELPRITADKEMTEKLVKELINNAIHFRRNGKRLVIDIGHDQFEGEVIFCVRDNGIGISRKDHQRIFEPFEILGNETGYAGKGFGLAVCQKIAAMHGGKIWVESLPGHGSNFYFTLNPATA